MAYVPRALNEQRVADAAHRRELAAMKGAAMTIRRNALYVFAKSGNCVKAIEPATYGGRENWVVERVDGKSAGKEMVVPGRALFPTDETRSG